MLYEKREIAALSPVSILSFEAYVPDLKSNLGRSQDLNVAKLVLAWFRTEFNVHCTCALHATYVIRPGSSHTGRCAQ